MDTYNLYYLAFLWKMKYRLFFLLCLSILLSGCSFDEAFENNQQRDGDDMNVIQDVWPQALDQALNLDPNIVIWSKVSEEVKSNPTQDLLYRPLNKNEKINNTVIIPQQNPDPIIEPNPIVNQPIIQDKPVLKNEYEWENEYEWQDD